MDIELFEPDKYGHPGGWILSKWESVDELLTFRDQKRIDYPDYQFLFVLDDVHQASYTSGHAVARDGLETFPDGLLTPEEQAAYDEQHTLTFERRSTIVINNMKALIKESELSLTDNYLVPIQDEPDLINAIQEPISVFNSTARCLKIPSPDPSMAIAAHPNGYFNGDLTPGQNYLLAEHLRHHYQYEILGLGSYLAAFVRPEPFSRNEVLAVVKSVSGMYENIDNNLINQWADASADKRWFVLSFLGS